MELTFLNFTLICIITIYGTALAHKIINRFEMGQDIEEVNLFTMLVNGELACELTIPEQVVLMAEAVDEDGNPVEIEELHADFDLVDIDKVKRELGKKNQQIKEIILEVR